MTYTYSKSNLIESPQKYQMTPFNGQEFIDDYFKLRQNVINELEITEIPSIKNLIKLITESNENRYKISTETKLISILNNFFTDELSTENYFIFEKFLKKFETTKKIYEEYSDDFISCSGSCTNYRNYLLLSIICILLYSKSKNLKFLNTSLKINDTMCSVSDLISNSTEKFLMFHSLKMETDAITTLMNFKGLTKS